MYRTIHLPRQNVIIALEEVHEGFELSDMDFRYAEKELNMALSSYKIRYIPSGSVGEKYFISAQTAIDISHFVSKKL